MAVEVREAAIEQADELLGLWEWLFEPPGARPWAWDPKVATRRLTEAIVDPEVAVLVAEEDGQPVGFCTAYLTVETIRFGQRCLVEELAVDPKHRSRGVGKALLDAAKDWARGAGASHLELNSGLAREDAHRFYEREQPRWKSYSYGWVL